MSPEGWFLGVSGLVLVLSVAAARVPTEERELRERFRDAWVHYAGRTRRFIT